MIRRTNAEISAGRVLFGLSLFALALGIFSPTAGKPALILFVALISSLMGRSHGSLFALGAMVGQAGDSFAGIPIIAILTLTILFGSILHAAGARARFSLDARLVLVTVSIAAFWIASPVETGPGKAAALALLMAPAATLVAYAANNASRASSQSAKWGALGLVTSLLPGLFDSLLIVNDDYVNYQAARVFESDIGSSNYAAGLSAVTGLLLLSIAHQERTRWLALTAAPFVIAPFTFASRGAILAIAVGGLTLLFAEYSRRDGVVQMRVIMASVFAVLFAFVAADQDWFWWDRLTFGLGDSGGDYSAGRSIVWHLAFQMIADHPLFGLGPGGVSEFLSSVSRVSYPHNFVLAWFGQVGLVLGILMMLSLGPRPIRLFTKATAPLIALVAHSLVEPVIETPNGALLLALLLGIHYSETHSEAHP